MRRSVVVGMAILSVSTAALLLVGSDTPGWQIAAILGSRGLALGLTIQLLLHEAGGTRRRAPRRRAPGGAVGAWHAPVVDHLGAAAPHGAAWPVVFVAFVAVLAAVRVLIGWLYTTTSSLLMAQLLHASSTASVVMLGPPAVSAAQEAFWYAVYAVALWGVLGVGLALGPGLSLPRPLRSTRDPRARPERSIVV